MQSSRTISRSWVAISLVAVGPRISSMNRRRPRGSRLAVGSSSTRTEGCRRARPPGKRLPFAEAQVVRSAVGRVFEVDPGETLERAPLGLGPAHPEVERAERQSSRTEVLKSWSSGS